MKHHLLLSFLFASFSTLAQQTPYQSFEVDSPAQPRGGVAYLTTFLEANLRKPLAAQAAGAGGRTTLSAIIEPDGSASDITIAGSFRPDCDQEAKRAFALFRAWQPAYKAGKPVRQRISTSVVFKPNKPFRYEHGKQILFFDADVNLLGDSTEGVKFKQVTSLDTNSLPTGDLVLYKLTNNQWAEYARDSLVRQKSKPADASAQPVYTIGHQLSANRLKGYLYTVNASGQILTESYYEQGKLAGSQLAYHSNGVLAEKKEHSDNRQVVVSWYANGQIRQVEEITTQNGPLTPDVINIVRTFWDSTGRQLVKDGNGQAIYFRTVPSHSDKNRETVLTEQGSYKNYLKQGTWTGRYADSSYAYEEQYDKGILLSGKSSADNQQATAYESEDHPPIFPGGLQGLSQFLSQNLNYPPDAQKDRAFGQVIISFVVCEDGTLCDYAVQKKVHFALDREALRVAKKMSGKWIAGVRNGKKVRVKYSVPINFSL